ncbi:MAG: D-tyrosyl-tRNA(Tyr) deacylase [Candidatus Marinimicrobia bacterium]|nr:D-tyrosyl-tRNA(Tyr) deacylase [Candidatus Neomarinimicrobiota bacterium]MCH8304416.1 D-tyrosyl-tRNA(Tyr) deacylase [Candidatus Neomarinimicrobiota bacterium]
MVAVLQRVSQGRVRVDKEIVGEIGKGLVILLGIFENDTAQEADKLADKTVNLRIFNDKNDKMNLSLIEVGGKALVISQFTLCADYKKGRRPNYLMAAEPQKAEELYLKYVDRIFNAGIKVQTGEFGAMMDVDIVNSGPVTITLDTKLLSKA